MAVRWAATNIHFSKEYYHSLSVSSTSLESFNMHQLGTIYISKAASSLIDILTPCLLYTSDAADE